MTAKELQDVIEKYHVRRCYELGSQSGTKVVQEVFDIVGDVYSELAKAFKSINDTGTYELYCSAADAAYETRNNLQ